MQFLKYAAIVLVIFSFVVLLVYLTKGNGKDADEVLILFFIVLGLLAVILGTLGLLHFRTSFVSKQKVEKVEKKLETKVDNVSNESSEQKTDLVEEKSSEEPINLEENQEETTKEVEDPDQIDTQEKTVKSEVGTKGDETTEAKTLKPISDNKNAEKEVKKQNRVKSLVKFCTENQHYKKHNDTPTTGDWFMGWLYVIAIVFVVILICLILRAVKLYP